VVGITDQAVGRIMDIPNNNPTKHLLECSTSHLRQEAIFLPNNSNLIRKAIILLSKSTLNSSTLQLLNSPAVLLHLSDNQAILCSAV